MIWVMTTDITLSRTNYEQQRRQPVTPLFADVLVP